MPSPRRSRSLHGRANQAGILFAAVNAPVTFERTLMPRGTMDQALVTGLAAAANHALIGLVQESIQSVALVASGQGRSVARDDRGWSRASIATDLAAIGAGIAVQRAFGQKHREPLTRAGIRTGGFWLSVAGTAGGLVGVLHELVDDGGHRARSFGVTAAAAAALAGVNVQLVRRRSRLDAALAPEETQASLAKSVGIGLGVVVGMSAFGAGERKLADAVGHVLARVLPGDAAIWRPVGHAAALAGFGYAARTIAVTGLHKIEEVQESAQAAFDIAPPSPWSSGSHESLVPFESLSRAGARYVWTTTGPAVLEAVMGEPARSVPIRAYVGLESAPTEQERVDLLMGELERTSAFDREWLMVASPTGTGYVNYAAVSILEFLTRGDCATMAMQYSARPSPLSLDRVKEGRRHMKMLSVALKARLDKCPPGKRPKVLLFGESLGAWTSQDAFVDSGTQGLVDAGFDYAIWIGTPHFSKWKERVLYDDRPDVDRSLIGVFDHVEELESLDPEARERLRFVMITHYNDGVGVFGPQLAIQAPEWLGPPETRHATVPKGMRWTPTTGFFQVLVDMKNAANVVPGVFAATGHDYRADLLPFFNAVLGLDATPDQLASIAAWLEARESVQSQWMKAHGTISKGLAATLLQQWLQEERDAGRDPDEWLLERFRRVAREEFGETSAVAAPTTPTS
jgi:uncharacterized membrane protein